MRAATGADIGRCLPRKTARPGTPEQAVWGVLP